MRLRTLLTILLVASGMILSDTIPCVRAQEPEKKKAEESKEVVVNGQLIDADEKDKVLSQSYCKTYMFKMTAGKMYQIDLKSTDFDSFLRLEDPQGKQVAQDDDSGGNLNARIQFRAPKAGEYKIIATSLGTAVGKFTLLVKEVPNQGGGAGGLAKSIELKSTDGVADYKGNLEQTDPMYRNKAHKLFLIAMQKGKTYQIDLKSKAFDSYLFLEDPDGNVLAMDDDGGGFPDARITWKASTDGKHRIIATYFGGRAGGEFTLTARLVDGGTPAPEKNAEPKKELPK